jgi:hypothetical protein
LKAKKNELISENKEKIPKIENEKEKKRKRTKRFRESPPQHRARLLSAESVVTSVFLFSQHRAAPRRRRPPSRELPFCAI